MYRYANKELRDQLAIKSVMVYGRRGKWKKVMREYGISVVQIEEVMDSMISRLRGNNGGDKTRQQQTENSTDTPTSVDGSSESI